MAVFVGFHRSPTVKTQQEAWAQIGIDALVQANADAVAARKAYREFLQRLETLRTIIRWMIDKDSVLQFEAVCDDLGVSPDDAKEKILRSAPPDIVEFLVEPHATCPLCHRAK